MNIKHQYILLDIIHNNGSVNRLINEGVKYDEIPELLNILIQNKLIAYFDEKISLTSFGKNKYIELQQEYKIVEKEKWIKPDNKNRIDRIDKFSIFVPLQSELNF